MQWSDISFQPTNRMLRQFALGLIVFLGGLAWWEEFGKDNRLAASVYAALALALGGAGVVYPRLLRWIFVGWMCLAFPVGWTISQVTLAILFYGVFTPIAVLFRLIGRDALNRRRPLDSESSYWQPKAAPRDVRAYFRQS